MATQIDNDAKVYSDRAEGYAKPGVVRDSNGRIYVAHYTASNELEVQYSDDNGTTWSLDTSFDDSDIDYISMAVSNNNDLFVSYCSGVSSPVNLIIKRRSASLGTWSEVLSESVSTNPQQPLLCFNSIVNRLYIFWRGSSNNISCRYTSDYGTTWTDIISNTLPLGQLTTRLEDLDFKNSGVIGVRSYDPTYSRTFIFGSDGLYIEYEDQGINTTSGAQFIYDSNNNRYMILVVNTTIYLYRNGVSLATIGGLGKPGHCALGADNDNNVYYIYTKNDEKCYYRKYNAETASLEASEVALSSGDGLRPACEKHSIPLSTASHVAYFSD
jgi:hypothetical protein